MRYLALAAILALAACATPQAPTRPAQRTNASTAADFLELNFRMESGRELPHFTRYEGPIRLATTGEVPPQAQSDLTKLLGRLRTEAKLDIQQIPQASQANLLLTFLPSAHLRKAVPQAACIVVPNVRSWSQFESARGTPLLDWGKLDERRLASIFIPADIAPQEIRDCLNEELAQAIGPLNDLYHLSDSVFNDDNMNTQLTSFDMLMLRTAYAPQLRSGMTQAEVAAQLPHILNRLHPSGGQHRPAALQNTPRRWTQKIETVLLGQQSPQDRLATAQSALREAHNSGWKDNRLAFSHFLMGRLLGRQDPKAAEDHFDSAAKLYAPLPNTALHLAQIDLQRAVLALGAGRYQDALEHAKRAQPPARQDNNTSLLALLAMIRATAHEALGQRQPAHAASLDSLALGRYAFGSEALAQSRLTQIKALAPKASDREKDQK